MPAGQPIPDENKSESMPLPCVCSDKPNKKVSTLRRKKLWNLQARFHCSVIGTCLTLNELRRLCRKANIVFETKVSDHELHSSFVNIAGESAYPSRLLQKHLDSKYKRSIQQFRRIHSENELQRLWLEAMKTGEVANAFWALVTHPSTADELLDQMYGDIHMLSHLAGASIRVDMQEFTRQGQRTKNLEAQLIKMRDNTRREIKDKEKNIQSRSERLARALASEQRLQQVEQRLVKFESGTELLEMRNKIEKLSSELNAVQLQKERAENTVKMWKQLVIPSGDLNMKLQQSLAESRHERDALETLLASFLSGTCQDACMLENDKTRQNPDLCNRCILYVGGRSSQKAHFRILVEQYNGRFIHHDGGREDSRHQLSSILPRADAVMCPLDCISHDAVHRVKQFCNRHGKPLILLPRGSLSAFAQGLVKVAL